MEFLYPPRVPRVAALPAAGTKGLVLLLTTDNHFYGDNGTAWDDLTAGSSPSVPQVEVSLGATPRRSGHFNLVGSGLVVGKAVLMHQANGPYTAKGARTDEAEMDRVTVSARVTTATNIECFWHSETFVKGNFKFDYLIGS